MEITKTQIKEILQTLPIGYYAKRKVNCFLDENEETSYYNPEKDEICFAYNNTFEALQNMENSKTDLEKIIRSVLYHELSHAILTPKNLMRITQSELEASAVNTFEDERIETLLNNYYLGTNFKKTACLINNYHGQPPQNDFEAFYFTVRFRNGHPAFVNRVEELIEKYKFINSKTKSDFCSTVVSYKEEIIALYKDIAKHYDKNKEQYQNNLFTGEPKITQIHLSSYAERQLNNENECFQELLSENTSMDFGDFLFNIPLNANNNSNLTEQLQSIISTFNKKNNSGNGINGYSGVLNPRLCGNSDYKFFCKKTTTRGNNAFGKLHLNLYIDTSGSFKPNETVVNTLIKSLETVENKNSNFSLNVVHCNIGEEIMDKNNYFIHPDGDNRLTEEIFYIYKFLQKNNEYNYNIFLFDGDAYPTRKDNFNLIDFNNCTIISDSRNCKYLEEIKKAKIIITNNYTDELYKNVIDTLSKAFR